MSGCITSESEDGMLSSDSPLIDEGGNCGGSSSGGGVLLKKGPWTSAEDAILIEYVKKHGEGNWNAVQKHSGLFRCGKSCRLRWANHLRPNLKKGAFTPEEERLIIELHAKMGNKWARMAAHLPGRTDNEIKNYWNTRIKRRQRAGLPLYPPELCIQSLQTNQHDQKVAGIHAGDKGNHDLLQAKGYEIPDLIFDSLNATQGALPYVPELSEISTSDTLMEGLGCTQYYSFIPPTVRRQKRIREVTGLLSEYNIGVAQAPPFEKMQCDNPADRISQCLGLCFPYDPDPIPLGLHHGSHSFSNGNFSASKPSGGALKLELPSLQYPETNAGGWGSPSLHPVLESVDSFIQSPPHGSGPLESDYSLPQNSGLLEALLYEARVLSNTKNPSPKRSSNSSTITPADMINTSSMNICSTEFESGAESISPFGNSTASMFNDSTPTTASGCSTGDNPPAKTHPGCHIKSEPIDHSFSPDREKKHTMSQVDFSRPDAILGSCWVEQSVSSVKGQGISTDAIAALLGDDLVSDYKTGAVGSAASNPTWSFGSCTWNNMPAVCQMSEFP